MRSVFLKLAAALFIASSFGAAAQAPSQAWLRTIDSGTAISDSTRVIRRMNNGDIIAASQVNTGPRIIRVTRHNGATGAVIWTADLAAPSATTNDTNDMVIDPATGDAYLASPVSVTGQQQNWFISKVRGSDGVVQWSTSFNGPANANDTPRSICMTSDGNVVVAGQYSLASGAPSNRVAKYNASTGVQMWAFEPTNEWQDFSQVVADGTGNAIAVGHLNATSLAVQNGYVVKFNASGTVVWSQTINGAANDFDTALTVDVDSAGNVYAGVESRVVPGMFTNDDDILVVKLAAATGVEQWRRSITGALAGSDTPYFITLDASDNVYVGGAVFESSATNSDALLAKLNSATGTVVWSITKTGTSGTGSESFRNIALNGAEIYAASIVENTVSATAQNDIYFGRFNPSNGATLWEVNYNSSGTRNDQISTRRGGALIAGATDTVFVAGQSQNAAATQPDGVILKYEPAVAVPAVSIAVAPASVLEDGAANLVYTVTRDAALATATVVNITTSGTATAGNDYVGNVATVTIPINALSATITIDPLVDGTLEADETVVLTVAAGSGYTVGSPAAATGTILNEELPFVFVGVSPTSVDEDGVTNLVYTISLDQPAFSPTTVNFVVAGTATSGIDYAAVSSPIVIPAGNSTGTITINPTADAIIEANETVVLTLAAGAGYVFGTPTSATGTITNDDLPSLSINDVTANEGNAGITNFTFTVSLSAPAGPGGVNFDIGTANGTATAGVDYVASSLTAQTIPAGSSIYSFTVLVNGETLNEAAETFFANVTNVTGASVNDGQGLGTIVNDDALPRFSINDVSVTEGNSGTTNAAFAVTLNAASGQTVQVNYATADGTATQPGDYTSTSGTLTFTPGQTTRPVTVPVVGDTLLEPNETYFVNLSGAVNATIIDNQGLGTIVDDECPSTVVLNGADSGAGTLRQTLAAACAGSTITFAPVVTTVSLTSAQLLIDKNLTIDGGSGVTVTRVAGSPDFRIFEVFGGSTVTLDSLTMSNGAASRGGVIQNNGNLTILDSVITGGNVTLEGGGISNFGDLQVSNSTISGNTARFAGGIFNRSAGASATIINSSIINNRAELAAGIQNDSATLVMRSSTVANNESTVSPTSNSAGGLLNLSNGVTATATLVNCTFSGNLQPSGTGTADDVSSISITPNSASVFLKNTLLGSASTGSPNLAISGTNATIVSQGNNLSSDSGAGVFGPGDLINTNPLLSSLGNYGGPTSTFALLPGSPAINAGNNSGAPTTDQRGIARPQQGTADIGAFESRGFTLTRASGNAQTAVVNTAFADPLMTLVESANAEPVEGGVVNYTVPGSGASAVLGSATATIINGRGNTSATANATAGTYAVGANTLGNLGSALSFSLTNRDLSADLSITKTNGTTSSIPGGSTTYTITASNNGLDPVTGATVADTFPASLSCTWTCVGTGGGTCPASGSGNINSAVNLPVAASVSYTAICAISAAATGTLSNTATVNSSIADPTPGNNSATDTDTLTPQADVSITKTDGQTSVNAGTNTTYTITASNAGPSNAPGTTVTDTFPAACTSVSWTCAGAGGGTCTASGNGNINQTVNLPSGGSVAYSATCAISTSATGTLSNTATVALAGGINDSAPGNNNATDTNTINDFPTLAINDVSITEGNSGTQVLNFTVTRTGVTASAVGFSFATADDTATAGSDYASATGTGTIPSGGATGTTTVSVTINGDAIFENNESFFVNLSAPTNALISDNQGVGTITNDETAPTLAINDVSIVEGNSGTQSLVFTVTRTGLTALPASFTAATANGTATAPSDYLAALTGSTTIAAGGATGTTTLTATINGDAVVEPDETFVINLTVPSNATISDNQATGTITNDDTAGIVLTQSGGSTDVTEGGAPDTYTLVLTSQPTSNVSIALNPDAQLTVATSPVVFTPANWNIAQTVTATAVDDTAVEGPHTGTISHAVTSADTVYNGFTVANVTANITDNDLPTLAINDVSLTEGNAGTQLLNFTVTRTGTTPSAVGFSFATADDTATAGSDYVTATGNGTIPSGGATGTTTVSVTINGDAIFENNESFFVNLTAPTNALISDAQGVGTINNDETAPTLAINDVSIVEGNSGTQNLVFTVTRTGLTALPAQFTAVTTPGTASAPLDYLAALTGSTTIAAGGASGSTTLTATINGDLTIEPNETFTVDLSAPVNATIADNQGLGTITNDDGEPTFTPASAISTQQGSPSAVATLGSVSDLTDPPNSLTVALISGGTVTGVTPTALANTNGTVTASLAASCTAASGTLRLRVTDSGGLTDTDDVQINVTPNSPPSLAYNPINVGVGNTSTQNPSAGLNDNGSVTGVSILSAGTFAGSVSVSTTGVLSLSNATPAGTHSITVRATDNCGAQTDAVVQVQVAQASTIKAISSNVNPARFGQSVSLSVQVSGVDPSGSVEFFNGSTSLGSAPLTVSPSGGNNLKLATLTLASLPVGSLNLTASYPGDTNNAASTSQVLAQSVVAADTSVALSTASNPLNLGSSSFNVSVQALTPGGGVPQGSVTLSAGAVNCVASLTAGSGSCSLNLASAGYAAISASYTPSTSNHNASTGGLAVVVVPTPSSADLRVRIGNGMRNISAGALVRYDIVVENLGTQAAVGRLEVPLSADFASASYSCTSAGSASCGAVGSGSIDTEVSVAPGGVVIYSLLVTAPISPERTITQTARITAKAPTTDPDPSNNDAADADPMGLLSDGYEDASIGE